MVEGEKVCHFKKIGQAFWDKQKCKVAPKGAIFILLCIIVPEAQQLPISKKKK